jgi:hypothetical protein
MPCYRCGVRQTDPSRGQSPWKRGVRRHSQILICPGCQDAADWTAELDRCSRCSSVHLVKRLGEVECRDCGTIVAPEGAGQAGLADDPAGAALEDESGVAGTALESEPGLGAGPGLEGAGRGADLSEDVARALDRVLGRSLVSQSIQRAPDPEGAVGPGAAGPGAAGARAGSSGARAGSAGSQAASAGSRAASAGSRAGRRRPARPESGRHAAADPAAERHRASRPGAAGADGTSLDAVRPGAFAG